MYPKGMTGECSEAVHPLIVNCIIKSGKQMHDQLKLKQESSLNTSLWAFISVMKHTWSCAYAWTGDSPADAFSMYNKTCLCIDVVGKSCSVSVMPHTAFLLPIPLPATINTLS